MSGYPLEGVTMQGLPGNPQTDEFGQYSAFVDHGSTVTVTPSLTGYSFDPSSKTYPPITYNQVNQNYSATIMEGYDDQFEGNDDIGEAKLISAGTIPNLQLLNDDWFQVDVNDVNSDLKVTLQGTLPNDIDVEIYDSAGNFLIAGISETAMETVYVSDILGTHYIRIPYEWSAGLQNSYSLTVEIKAVGYFQTGDISGSIVDENNPATGINTRVEIRDLHGLSLWQTLSDANGAYSISIPAGEFKVLFDTQPLEGFYGGANYIGEWHSNKPTFSRAEVVTISDGDSLTIDAELIPGGVVTGRITDSGN
ncbi:MAG: hypothetical protein ACXABY_37585, partial [Candidatus Thorarchaeota archaeon]